MDAQVETIEARLHYFLGQLQSELGVLDRIVHKNKNQHRRSSYLQYLLKVRRDCRLLQSTNLEEIVKPSFLVINGNRPKQSLKRRNFDGGKHTFLVRLQGAARLLSQMVEPMLKVSYLWKVFQFVLPCYPLSFIEISTLLVRSFFMGFSMTVLALLARLRVLTQQVFREYYLTVVFLECVWETDNFILLERSGPETIKDDVICQGLSTVEYQSIETIVGDNKSMDIIMDKTPEEDTGTMRTDNLSSM